MKREIPEQIILSFFIVSTLLLYPLKPGSGAAVDETLEERKIGKEIVEAVIRKIRRSQIFLDDYDLLKRIAYIETNFGENPDTFRPDFYGGIWALNEEQFQATKSGKLEKYHAKIKKVFEIKWSALTWMDLQKPLHSGLAMRLLLQSVTDSIPQTPEGQAALWQKLFGRDQDDASLKKFLDSVKTLEESEKNCGGNLDLTVLLDGSGSVGIEDFEKSKDFVINLFSNYTSSGVRLGFILFGEDAYLIFGLDNNFNLQEKLSVVKNVVYPSESTNTNAGILASVNMIKSSSPRPGGTPSILIVFTDGESNVGDGVNNIRFAKEANITTFAVGIGPRINQAELLEITYNDASRIFNVQDFDTLKTLAHRINGETCLVNFRPELNETFNDELLKNENRYFSYPITEKGLIVKRHNIVGKTNGYYSLSDPNPSKSVHDGILNDETYIPPPIQDQNDGSIGAKEEVSGIDSGFTSGNSGKTTTFPFQNEEDIESQFGTNNKKDKVYISMIGQDPYNSYTIECFTGNGTHQELVQASTTAMTTTTSTSTTAATTTSRTTTTTTIPIPTRTTTILTTTFKPNSSGFGLGNVQNIPQFGNFGPSGNRNSNSNLNAKCKDNHVQFQEFPGRCDIYTLCACGVKVLLECAPGLYFDPITKSCNFIQLVDCQYSTSYVPNVIRQTFGNSSTPFA